MEIYHPLKRGVPFHHQTDVMLLWLTVLLIPGSPKEEIREGWMGEAVSEGGRPIF
jgi:hypothetical protein